MWRIPPDQAVLIVGLGNPGPRYGKTRHNVGFMAVRRLAERSGVRLGKRLHGALVGRGAVQGRPIVLALPELYMNRSGLAVAALLDDLGIESNRLVVVHDDLDLPVGTVRVKRGGGHGGHNGLRSLIAELGTGDFRRVKMGIGRPAEGWSAEEWVLSDFAPEEWELVNDGLERTADEAAKLIGEDDWKPDEPAGDNLHS